MIHFACMLRTMEDIPSRDQRLLDTKPESKTSSESDAKYSSSCQEDADDSAIELVFLVNKSARKGPQKAAGRYG